MICLISILQAFDTQEQNLASHFVFKKTRQREIYAIISIDLNNLELFSIHLTT